MKRRLNFVVLIILLAIRYGGDFLALSQLDSKLTMIIKIAIIFSTFIIILFTIWLNRKNIKEINLDKISFLFLMGVCVIIAWDYLPFQLSILLFLAIAKNIFSYLKNEFEFQTGNYSLKKLLTASIIFIPLIILILVKGIEINDKLIINAFIGANLFGVAFEEFLFRGLLWKVLRDFGLTESKTLIVQAFVFWIAHYHLFLSGSLSFWVTIPFIALMLGIVIKQSKSLALSVVVHFLYNFLTGFIKI